MAHWLEDLVADEKYYLIKELRDGKAATGSDDPTKMAEVRLCEKVLDYIRGSMEEAGWTTG